MIDEIRLNNPIHFQRREKRKKHAMLFAQLEASSRCYVRALSRACRYFRDRSAAEDCRATLGGGSHRI
jgi:hypothetical protein